MFNFTLTKPHSSSTSSFPTGELFLSDISEYITPTTNTWNYKNELTQTSRGCTTVGYLYDENGTRIFKKDGSLATSYPSPYFTQTNTGTTTTLVMVGNENLATITNGSVLWNHTDHVGSTVATTNEQGNTVETTQYSSFGHQLERNTYNNTQQSEKYTNHTYDPETDLLYAQARYYRGSMGRFLGQDPVFWGLGTEDKRSKLALLDPQLQNSYSYGRNNPLKYIDEDGEFAFLVPLYLATSAILEGAGGVATAYTTYKAAQGVGTFLGTYFSDAPQSYKDQVYSQTLDSLGSSLTGVQAVGGLGVKIGSNKSQHSFSDKEINNVSTNIGKGHAYEKHVVQEKQFGNQFSSKDQFISHIKSVITKPTESRILENDRRGFFDLKSNTIIITNPTARDGGTAFRGSLKQFNKLK